MYPVVHNNKARLQWTDTLTAVFTRIPEVVYVSSKQDVEYGTVVLHKESITTDITVKGGYIIICGTIIKVENRIEKFMKVEAGATIENKPIRLYIETKGGCINDE